MISIELSTIILGIASAISFGAGDFCGGLASKRSSAFAVVVLSQVAGGLMLSLAPILFREQMPSLQVMMSGALAGLAGGAGLVLLYRGLADQQMGIFAPITAIVGAVFPVVFGAFSEGLPTLIQLMGFCAALAAVWLLTSGVSTGKIRGREYFLPFVSGLFFGIFFILIGRASEKAVLWPLVAARAASMSFLVLLSAIRGTRIAATRAVWLPLILAGLLDAGGNVFFALAARVGRLDIAAILTSLYPGATVLLAWLILKESLTVRQWFGIMAALAGIILIRL